MTEEALRHLRARAIVRAQEEYARRACGGGHWACGVTNTGERTNILSSHMPLTWQQRLAAHTSVPAPRPACSPPHDPQRRPEFRECCGEFIGTFLLCFVGLGSVASSAYSESMAGLWQVASVWGFAVTIGT